MRHISAEMVRLARAERHPNSLAEELPNGRSPQTCQQLMVRGSSIITLPPIWKAVTLTSGAVLEDTQALDTSSVDSADRQG
jgi:hypothetical protein